MSKYYNLKINIFSKEDKENTEELKLLQTINISKSETNINLNLICDKNITQTYQIFIKLIDKNEIYNNSNINNYIINLLKRSDEYQYLFPDFSNFLLWIIMNTIQIIFVSEKVLNELNGTIIDIYLDTMFKLGLYEQIINFITQNIDTFLKNDKRYYIILYNSYKKLCLYDDCIEAIKKYLYLNNSINKILNYETVQKINKLKQIDFNSIYSSYKNLEKERPIIFTPPLMDEDLLKILNDKCKELDDNIFNLEAQLYEEKIEINEKAKVQKMLEKKKDGNKFRILCIEGGGMKFFLWNSKFIFKLIYFLSSSLK